MKGLAGKVAIVTGATAGLGRAVALRLAEERACLVLVGRNAQAGEALAREIEGMGAQALFTAADLEDAASTNAMAACAAARFGGIDIVVASAGASSVARGIFAEVEPEAVAQQVARTIRMKLNPVHAALPHLKARGGGAVLFITSEGGRFPTPGQTAVAFHSGGLIMASKVIAKELSRDLIRVNTLCVTLVRDTPAYERFSSGEAPAIRQKVYGRIEAQAPFGLALPHQIAGTAAWLVSDDASHVTGATLSATGGATYS